MAAVAFPSGARRRPATYGKTTTKRVEGYNSEDVIPSLSPKVARRRRQEDADKIMQKDGTVPNARTSEFNKASRAMATPHDIGLLSCSNVTSSARTEQLGKIRAAEGSKRLAEGAGQMASQLQTEKTSVNDGVTGAHELGVYEVPSSDEELGNRGLKSNQLKQGRPKASSSQQHRLYNVRSTLSRSPSKSILTSQATNLTNTFATKKRKRANAQGDGDVLVFDDQTLQKHVCIEVATDRSPQRRDGDGKRETARPQTLNQPTTPSRHRMPHRSPEKGSGNNKSPMKSSVSVVITVNNRSTEATLQQAHAPRVSEADTRGQQSRPPLPSPTTPPPTSRRVPNRSLKTPPRSAQHGSLENDSPSPGSSVKSPTPRQTNLWNLLLEPDQEGTSPTVRRLNRLALSTENETNHFTDRGSLAESMTERPAVNDSASDEIHRRKLDRAIPFQQIEKHAQHATSQSSTGSDNFYDMDIVHGGSQSQSQSSGDKARDGLHSQDISSTSQAESIISQAVLPPTLPGIQGTGPKLTYARQRSYLSESSLNDELGFSAPIQPGVNLGAGPRSRRGQRGMIPIRTLSSLTDDQATLDIGQSGTIRSIHELREAGSNRRLHDELEHLLEDVHDRRSASTSKRRSSLLEIANKLHNKSVARRFIDLGLDRRLFSKLQTEEDVIISFLMASSIVILAQSTLDGHSLSHMCQEGALEMLTRLLGVDRAITSVTKDRQINMSKVSRDMVADFGALMAGLSLWTKGQPSISPRIISLKAIETLVKSLREVGDVRITLPSETAKQITSILATASSTLTPSDCWRAQVALETEACLLILEACTSYTTSKDDVWDSDTGLISTMCDCLPLICRGNTDTMTHLKPLVLRVILNLTNNNSHFCEKLGTETSVTTLAEVVIFEFSRQQDAADEEERMQSLDYLILALVTMINLVESGPTARTHVLGPLSDDGSNLLGGLMQPFLRGLEKTTEAASLEETQFNVALGYLSVLLSYLCLNDDVRAQVRLRLPGRRLRPMINMALEFLHYHKEVDAHLHSVAVVEGGVHPQDGFTERLQSVIESLAET